MLFSPPSQPSLPSRERTLLTVPSTNSPSKPMDIQNIPGHKLLPHMYKIYCPLPRWRRALTRRGHLAGDVSPIHPPGTKAFLSLAEADGSRPACRRARHGVPTWLAPIFRTALSSHCSLTRS